MIDIHSRLINWGRARWCTLMADAPDGRCVNPMYEQMIPGGGEGYAQDGEGAIVALRTEPARAEAAEVDEDDAEVIQGWVRQLCQSHRVTLSRRFVTRERVSRDEQESAIRALQGLMDSNYETIREMQRRLRG